MIETTEQAVTPNTAPKRETITLEEPIVRGEQTIAEIEIRKPKAGELRGLKMQDLMAGDVNSVIAVLPRISVPPVLPHEAENLDLADLAAVTGAVMGFFMSKTDQAMMARFMGLAEESTN